MKTIFVKSKATDGNGMPKQTGLLVRVPENIASDEGLYSYVKFKGEITLHVADTGEPLVTLSAEQFEREWRGD